MLEINEKKLHKELAEARRGLDRRPDNPRRMDMVASCLRWLGDPEVEELFARAATLDEGKVRAAEEQSRDVTARRLLTLDGIIVWPDTRSALTGGTSAPSLASGRRKRSRGR